MKFAADEMLGKLAKWLRIAGQDVFYKNKISDKELVSLCQAERRVLLTRDTLLISQCQGIRTLLIVSDHFREQLKQVFTAFRLEPLSLAGSRCLLCNQELEKVAKEKVKDQVPPYVFATQESFWRCPGCQRLFWPGTHYQRMLKDLETLREEGA